jgi:mono/diheme cytochrome c family protein
MPAFRDRLSDQQVADLLTFVRASWGNRGGAVTAQQVSTMRALPPAGQTMMTGYDPRAQAEPSSSP